MTSKSAKNKVSSSGNQTHNTNYHWIIILSTQPICHSLQVSDFQTLKIHALLNLQMIQVQFGSSIQHMSGWQSGIHIYHEIHRWLVLWVQFLLEATLFLLILKLLDVHFEQKCQKCLICVFTKNLGIWSDVCVCTWIEKSWLPCWLPRGQQVSHRRWIWGSHRWESEQVRIHPSWLWNTGQTLPEVQNRVISDPTKGRPPRKFLKSFGVCELDQPVFRPRKLLSKTSSHEWSDMKISI